MRYPEFLKQNDSITLIGKSLDETDTSYNYDIKEAHRILIREGFSTYLGDNPINSFFKETRLSFYEQIKNNYLDSNAFLYIGGDKNANIITHLDLERIRKSRAKFFIGSSTYNNVIFAIVTLCDIAAIYGPNAIEFKNIYKEKYLSDTLNLIRGNKLSFSSYNHYVKDGQRMISYIENYPTYEAKFEGRVIGGSLCALEEICSTKYDHVEFFYHRYQSDGIIWFIDTRDMSIYDMSIALNKLIANSWFNYVTGFVISRNTKVIYENYKELFISKLKKYNVPIIINGDFGIDFPKLPIYLGACAKIEAKDSLKITYILK